MSTACVDGAREDGLGRSGGDDGIETVRLAAEARDVPAKTARLFSTSIVAVKGIMDVICSKQALSKVQRS